MFEIKKTASEKDLIAAFGALVRNSANAMQTYLANEAVGDDDPVSEHRFKKELANNIVLVYFLCDLIAETCGIDDESLEWRQAEEKLEETDFYMEYCEPGAERDGIAKAIGAIIGGKVVGL